MAQTSGVTTPDSPVESFRRASFTHKPTGFLYRVSPYFLEFEKSKDGSLHGRKPMPYFVGSGAVARSYLLQTDGFVYEAPVAYYTEAARWDLAPGYSRYGYPYLTRPVPATCLTCHASFLRLVAGTQNRFESPPFGEAGIACERCHGPGEDHIQNGGAIVNPAKLAPDRRDSVCSQCHLSGEVRVFRAGATWHSYHPGERLSDSVTAFVRAGATPGMTVTGHVEKLAQSACKRAAGDKLWCGTCHDPHTVPESSKRASWFRAKCESCHQCKESREARDRRANDCTACHMPKSPVTDAEHVVYTDHSIPRRPRPPTKPADSFELVAFGGERTSDRDLALAYGIAASRKPNPAAQKLLETAAAKSPDDVEVLLYLAEIYRNNDQNDRAIPLYERAIRLDPAQVSGSVGLGGIRFQMGDNAEAIRLWQDALAKNAGLELVRTNLAMTQWRTGDRRGAEATLRKAIELSPAFTPARELLERLLQ